MRVVVVHWALPPTGGGVESSLAHLVKLYEAERVECIFVSGQIEPASRWFGSTNCIYIADLDRSATVESTGAALHQLDQLFRSFAPDLVHAHNLHIYDLAPLAAIIELKGRYGYRLVQTYHVAQGLEEAAVLVRQCDAHHAVSHYVAMRLKRQYGLEATVIHLAVDTNQFKPLLVVEPGNRGNFTVLHPGRMRPGKGFEHSIRLLASLRSKGINCRLSIATPKSTVKRFEEYSAAIRRAISESGVKEYIKVANVAHDEMAHLYRSCDVVVHPSELEEAFGLVPVEAMSCAKPIVCSGLGAVRETVLDGVTGFLVDTSRPSELLDAVSGLLCDPVKARLIGMQGRAHVESRFEISHFGAALLHLYRTALDK